MTDEVRAGNGRGGGAWGGPRQGSGLASHQARKTAYQADMAQLELEARRGKLVPIENVAAAAVRCGEMMVKILDQLPNRADDLAEAVVKGGTFSVRRVLKDIACEARSRLATELQKLAEIPEPSEIAEWPKDEETLDAVEQNTRLRFERLAEVPT